MNVIQQPNKEITFLLGVNPYFKDWTYRLNKYCIVDELEDGTTLMFNTMTRAMVSLSEIEKETMFNYGTERFEFLLNNYFIVKDDYDEEAELDKIKFKWAPVIDDRYIEERYDFLIVTTTGCNARCFYCYERKISKVPMTLKTAEDVVQYILKKAKNPNREIKLDWFGGEPLFNMKVIDHICQRLIDNNRKFRSTMISNGYLFDEKVVKKAADFWKLNHVQITLDGTEEVYNKAKNYIYKNQDEVSPFKKVMNNIELLVNNDIAVSIRMNVDLYNAEDLKVLINDLGEKYKDNKKLAVYVWPIFEDEEFSRDEEHRQNVFDKIYELEEVMLKYGWARGGNIGPSIRSHHCMIDGQYNVIIGTQGDLGLCEHYVSEDFFGSIYHDNIDWDVVKSYRQYQPKIEACHTCPRYPSCLRPIKCKDMRSCTPQFQEFELRHDKQSMRKMYNQWIEEDRQRRTGNSGNNCNGGNCQTPQNNNGNGSCNAYYRQPTHCSQYNGQPGTVRIDSVPTNDTIDLSKLSFWGKAKLLFSKNK